MAKLAANPRIELRVTLALSEEEARALAALTQASVDDFLKVFHTYLLGQKLLGPHDAGLRSFWESVQTIMPLLLDRTAKARQTFIEGD